MKPRLKIGVLYSRVRVEEKWIFSAMEKRGIDYERLDDRAIHFDLSNPTPWQRFDAVLERSISYNSGLYALRLLQAFGVPTVNTADVAEICGDKLITSAVLARDGLPQPHNATAFTPEAALEAIEAFGYPVVLKPTDGNHGRGVCVDLADEQAVRNHFAVARAESRSGSVIVEHQTAATPETVAILVESATARIRCARSSARSMPAAFTL